MAVIFTLVVGSSTSGGRGGRLAATNGGRGGRLAATNEIQTNANIEKILFMISQTNYRYNQFGENASSVQSMINVDINNTILASKNKISYIFLCIPQLNQWKI